MSFRRDSRVGPLQIAFQRGLVAFAGFAQHPAYGFVDQVVRMVQEDIGDGECIIQLPLANELQGAHNPDALLPEGFAAARQVVEQCAVLVQQPGSQQRVTAQIHQVPIVDVFRV